MILRKEKEGWVDMVVNIPSSFALLHQSFLLQTALEIASLFHLPTRLP
jgi:hypothetical protein